MACEANRHRSGGVNYNNRMQKAQSAFQAEFKVQAEAVSYFKNLLDLSTSEFIEEGSYHNEELMKLVIREKPLFQDDASLEEMCGEIDSALSLIKYPSLQNDIKAIQKQASLYSIKIQITF